MAKHAYQKCVGHHRKQGMTMKQANVACHKTFKSKGLFKAGKGKAACPCVMHKGKCAKRKG